jgi:hypothetical protein
MPDVSGSGKPLRWYSSTKYTMPIEVGNRSFQYCFLVAVDDNRI